MTCCRTGAAAQHTAQASQWPATPLVSAAAASASSMHLQASPAYCDVLNAHSNRSTLTATAAICGAVSVVRGALQGTAAVADAAEDLTSPPHSVGVHVAIGIPL